MCIDNNMMAWENFVTRFHQHIKLCASREVQKSELNKSYVNEIVQEVFLNLLSHNYKTLRDFYGTKDSDMNAYLTTIVYHISLRILRKEHTHKRNIIALRQLLGVDEENHFSKMFEEELSAENIQDLLENILAGPHSSRDALIFYLHAVVGLSAREIGQLPAISLSITNVNTIISRTKERLRDLFSKDYLRNLYFT